MYLGRSAVQNGSKGHRMQNSHVAQPCTMASRFPNPTRYPLLTCSLYSLLDQVLLSLSTNDILGHIILCGGASCVLQGI